MLYVSANSSAASSQTAFYVAINLQNILYGIALCVYLKIMYILLVRRKASRGSDMVYACFSTISIFMVTIRVITDAVVGEELWLLDPNHSGGGLVYGQGRAPGSCINVGAVAALILQQMAAAIMTYRCSIIWDNRRIIVMPIVLWMTTLVLGILVIWTSNYARTDFFYGISANLSLAYCSTAVFLHTSLTFMICYRFVRHAMTVRKYLGEEHANVYFNIVMLFVESVLPCTVTGIAFVISFGLGSRAEVVLSRAWTLMMCVAPQLLILRVAEGNAWKTKSKKKPASVMVFSPGPQNISALGPLDGSGAQSNRGSLPSSMSTPDSVDEMDYPKAGEIFYSTSDAPEKPVIL